MKNLVLAEKPSVGRELARVLCCSNHGNFFENETYIVTWALGHLVTLAPPDKYSEQYKRWNIKSLPILPETLQTEVIEKTQEQFDLVSGLLNREDVDQIIIATDAGREGELVARWILSEANCQKPIKRLWISSQTDSAIKQGFENLKDGHAYDNLYFAARSRSYADWYIGYNVSRAMTCHFDTRLSAGRVQTPTLALITKREEEIENFTGRFFWTLRADFGSFKASRYSKENTVKIDTEKEANELAKKLEGKDGKVISVKQVPNSEKPPLAYDLTELQRDANKILGFSAKETLDTLQRLYEVHKIVTYPRTDSRYITDDIVPTLGDRLLALTETPFVGTALSFAKKGIRKDLSNLVNNAMVSDHHALLPTEQKVNLAKLSENEKKLWTLVIKRFLQTLSEDYEYATTTVEAEVEGERFSARVTVPVNPGWKETDNDNSDNQEEAPASILALREGDSLHIANVEIKRASTPAPSRFTEADLLYAMEHAGKYVEDEQLKKRLENGLGTPATRADIIEKLIQNNCIERQGLEIVPTQKGRELVRLVPLQLQSAELTGRWEQRLFEISNGNEDEKQFLEDIKKNASDLVQQVISNHEKFNPSLMGNAGKDCPFCHWPMIKVLDEFDRVHRVCQRFSCGYEEMDTVVEKTKQKLILKKADGKTLSIQKKPEWENTTKVVKESHYHPKPVSVHKDTQQSLKPAFKKENESSGGTFADFIKAAEERKKRNEERKNRK